MFCCKLVIFCLPALVFMSSPVVCILPVEEGLTAKFRSVWYKAYKSATQQQSDTDTNAWLKKLTTVFLQNDMFHLLKIIT